MAYVILAEEQLQPGLIVVFAGRTWKFDPAKGYEPWIRIYGSRVDVNCRTWGIETQPVEVVRWGGAEVYWDDEVRPYSEDYLETGEPVQDYLDAMDKLMSEDES